MFPVTLSSPPSSSPSSPPLPHPAVPSPTPPRSGPPSPSRISSFAPIPTLGKPVLSSDGSHVGGDLTQGREAGETATSTSLRASDRSTEPPHDIWAAPARPPSPRPSMHPSTHSHSREPSLPTPSPWEGSPTSSMSTLSRLEDSLPRTGDTSPPSGVEEGRETKGSAVDDDDLIVRLDEYGGGWNRGSDGWRLGVDFGASNDHKNGTDHDFRFPDSRSYAAHVFSAESSSGEPSPASAHRPLPPAHLHSTHSSPTDLLSPLTPVTSSTSPPLASPFPSYENLISPSSPARSAAGPYLRTTSSRTTTTTTTTRTHVRGSSLSLPAISPVKPTDRLGEPSERARTRSGFSFSPAVGTGGRAASVRSWHSDEDDEDEEEIKPRLRRERIASETPVGSDGSSQSAAGYPSRRQQASSLHSSPSHRRSELPTPTSATYSTYSQRSPRTNAQQSLPKTTSRPSVHPGTSTLHRTRSSSSSQPGLGAFGFAFPTISTPHGDDDADFDSTPTPSPTPALGGDRRRKTTKSAPSSRLNLSAMFKAAGAGTGDARRVSSDRKAGGLFGLVKDGLQALHHHHQQATEAAEAAISPNSAFSRSSQQSTSPSASYLSPTASLAQPRSNSPSLAEADEQALTVFTRPIYPIAKFATLIAISFFALLALSTVLVGSYGLTAWDVGRLRIAGARETVQGGRRMIERGVERAREAMSGTGTSPDEDAEPEETKGPSKDWKRPEKKTTEEAFKQLHEAAATAVRRVVPSALTGLLFSSSTRSPPASSGRSRKRSGDKESSSKRQHHGRKPSGDDAPTPSARTAPHSRQSSRRPSFSTPASYSADDRDPPAAADPSTGRSRPRSRRPSYRTPSPSPTRQGGSSEGRYTFGASSPTTPTQASEKKRSGKSSAPGLPPRPPLGLLIPSIVLTLVIAVCALVGGFIKGWQGRGGGAVKGKRAARAR